MIPRKPKQIGKLATVLVVGIVLSSCSRQATADAQLEGTNPAQWRLIWTNEPATSATVAWNTAEAGTTHQVLLRQDGSDEVQTISSRRDGKYSGKSMELYFHHVQLDGLEPSTKYFLTLESDEKRSPEMFFVTAPSDDVPISILFGADSRSGRDSRRQMNAMLANMLAESYAAERVPVLALAHGGDFIYDGRNLQQWSIWMSDHELTVTEDGQMLPIIPARGNHDGGEMFNEVFAFPVRDRNYYHIDLGPQVRLVTLNTEISVAGDQRSWLAKTLATSRPQKRWLIAQYHRPAFPAVKVPGLNLVHWVPLFEQHNVDLVCEGDGHNIKRTPPIRSFSTDPTGVVYIGEGGLGVGQRTPKQTRWYLNTPQAKTGMGHHVQLLTFDAEQFTYRAVLLGGEVFDEYTRAARQPIATTKN